MYVTLMNLKQVNDVKALAKMTKEAGKVASEYKDELEKVPDEFKKGYDEAQIDSKSRKAKPMERLPDEK